ncbi:MAG: TonB-dependent receptor plug domain-containing protein [Opitutaceae bacterium]|nr:TonB-dependent receptor plug domain-containing protein [Opitutaceae bacterium]
MKTIVHLVAGWVALALIPGALSLAQAQSVTPAGPSPSADKSDETVTLSPFIVVTDHDSGYIAADTINAGRMRMNLLMTPGDMEVFTRDLLDDLGVFNMDEAVGWLTSSHPYETGGINGNSMNPASLGLHESGGNVSLRGMATQPSTRNYFLSATTPMEYNVQRVEAGRGPNAILYGEGGPGGGVNYITKKPQGRPFGSFRLRLDSEGSLGMSLDFNRPLTPNLGVRYNASALDQRHFVDRVKMKSMGNALSVLYRPWERTQINVDADFTRTERPGFIMTSFTDQNSSWNAVPVTTPLTTAQATAAGLALRTGTHFWTWVDGMGMLDLRGTAYTNGAGIPLVFSYPAGIANVPPPDKSFNAQPGQINVRANTVDLQASADHSFRNGFSMQLAGQYAKYRAKGGNYAFTGALKDPNAFLPGGIPNPNFGKIYSYSYYGRKIDGTYRESKTVRLVAAYPIRGFGGITNVSAFAHHQESDSRTIYWDPHIVDPTSNLSILDNSSRIYFYRYWDNITPSFPDFSRMYDLVDVPTGEGFVENKNDAWEVAASGSYLKDRLTYVAGFRRDRSDLTTRNGDTASRDRVTGAFGAYTVDSRVAYNDVKTFGVVYFPLEKVGLYADYAEGFTIQTNANPRIDGTFERANIVPSKSESLGLRFRIARTDRLAIVGSAGYYKAKQENSAAGINIGSINQLWANHGMPERYIETFSSAPTSTSSVNAIQSTRSYSGWGWEGNVTVNVASRLRLVANLALPDTKQFDTAPDYRAYVATHMPQWEQWANDPANPARTSDANSVRSIQSFINGFQDDRRQNGTYKYRCNITGVYTMRKGALRGLRIGAGSQFYGQRLVGNQIDRPYDYVYGPAYNLVSGSLGYQVKFPHGRLDLQFNVDNLLDYDDPIYHGKTNYQGRLIEYGFRRVNPRSFRLTSTLSF